MLKQTGLSLLFGALVLTALLKFVFLAPGTTIQNAAPLRWDAGVASDNNPLVEQHGNAATIVLTKAGASFATINLTSFPADSYAFLHLALDQSNTKGEVMLLWNTSESPGEHRSYKLESYSRKSMWLSTRELRGWEGEISSLLLLVAGQEGDTLTINDASLFAPSLQLQLRAIYSDFTAFVPWNRAAVNAHTGATHVSSFYPITLIACWLTLSLVGYSILSVVRASVRFDWRVVGLIFLACWLVVDFSWQNRLVRQLADTYDSFAGKTTKEKLTVGPDAPLYNFMLAVNDQTNSAGSRIFVSSSDHYTGLRGAYYLYPKNVFWTLKGPQVQPGHYLRSGDYIVLLKPNDATIDHEKNTLLASPHDLQIEVLLRDTVGQLVRVN